MDGAKVFRIAFSLDSLSGKLAPGDPYWREFNGSFKNFELSAPAISCMIDDGHAFTTWHANGWRDSKNYLCGQHLGIDFDSASVSQVLADPFVQRYGSIVYATPSSTPEAPRSRAVFLLDAPIMQAVNYVAAASALIAVFGGHADRQCKDAARFFYGSVGSMPTRLDNVLPLRVVRDIIAKHATIQAMQHRPRPSQYTPHTADAAEAQRLLDRLAPARADDYNDWITVGMALSTLGAEGLSLWESWSSRSAKHHEGECERKWRSFDGSGVTIGTLVHMAQQDSPHGKPG